MKTVYKIQAEDGTFSGGGARPKFTSRGKQWQSAGHVSTHLSLLSENSLARYRMRSAKVVTYQVVEEPISECSVDEWKAGVEARRALRNKPRQQAPFGAKSIEGNSIVLSDGSRVPILPSFPRS